MSLCTATSGRWDVASCWSSSDSVQLRFVDAVAFARVVRGFVVSAPSPMASRVKQP